MLLFIVLWSALNIVVLKVLYKCSATTNTITTTTTTTTTTNTTTTTTTTTK